MLRVPCSPSSCHPWFCQINHEEHEGRKEMHDNPKRRIPTRVLLPGYCGPTRFLLGSYSRPTQALPLPGIAKPRYFPEKHEANRIEAAREKIPGRGGKKRLPAEIERGSLQSASLRPCFPPRPRVPGTPIRGRSHAGSKLMAPPLQAPCRKRNVPQCLKMSRVCDLFWGGCPRR
jgi:hypothetical protein